MDNNPDYPSVGEEVRVVVQRITPIGAHVFLPLYGDKEGIILRSNITGKRIVTVSNHLKIGLPYVMRVSRVDIAKEEIDLTMKHMY